MGKLIKGIHHIALRCRDIEQYREAIHFYHDILGMEIVRTWADGTNAMLDTGSGLMEIFSTGLVSGSTGAVNHFALATDDVDACLAAVEAAGYRITVPAKDIAIPSNPVYPARIGFCIGPVGEEIEFFDAG